MILSPKRSESKMEVSIKNPKTNRIDGTVTLSDETGIIFQHQFGAKAERVYNKIKNSAPEEWLIVARKQKQSFNQSLARKERDQAMRDLGLTKVKGALGGTYWE